MIFQKRWTTCIHCQYRGYFKRGCMVVADQRAFQVPKTQVFRIFLSALVHIRHNIARRLWLLDAPLPSENERLFYAKQSNPQSVSQLSRGSSCKCPQMAVTKSNNLVTVNLEKRTVDSTRRNLWKRISSFGIVYYSHASRERFSKVSRKRRVQFPAHERTNEVVQ